MRTREDCKKGKDGRRNPVCLNFSFGVLFWQSSPKKEPQKCFSDYRIRYRKIRKDVAFQNKYIFFTVKGNSEWIYFLLLIQALWWLSYWVLSFLGVISERFSIVKGMIPGFLRVAYIRCLYYWQAFILSWSVPCFIRNPYLFMIDARFSNRGLWLFLLVYITCYSMSLS